MKTQKGITLIALIITIIVMLILVRVSISVALNTGLFKSAQGVAKNTEGARINEIKLSDGTVNIGGEQVDITDINNLNDYLEKQELKAQGYTHILVLEDFSCPIKEDDTFADLIEKYNKFTTNGDGIVLFNNQCVFSSGYIEFYEGGVEVNSTVWWSDFRAEDLIVSLGSTFVGYAENGTQYRRLIVGLTSGEENSNPTNAEDACGKCGVHPL